MELRSSRSRSRTPFDQNSIEKEVDEHVVSRTTRSRIHITTYGNTTTETKPSKRLQKTRIKTSDYSSEDGESEITSSRDNKRNQLKEEVLKSTNGKSDVSALKLYKEAGEYWNKFPKTDYTYSRHSRDRVELAPGVVVMPNMSRRSLHNFNGSHNFTANKQTSTESCDEVDHEEESHVANHVSQFRPRTLFNSSRCDETREYVISRWSGYRKETITSRFYAVFALLVYPFYYVYAKQHGVFLWFGKTLHKIVSRVMLLDTWLLRGFQSKNKLPVIFALCLLPLLFFAGWWLLSGLSQQVYGTFFDVTAPPFAHVEEKLTAPSGTNSIRGSGEMASKLSDEQLKFIANSISNNDDAVNDLRNEIGKIRLELSQLEETRRADLGKISADFGKENAFLLRQINNCCRRYFIHMERYVTKILTDLLGAPGYVVNKRDLSTWLHSIFVAKQDLELQLDNLTSSLRSHYDSLINNNGQAIMDDVARRISVELNERLGKTSVAAVNLDSLTDEYVKKIVHDALAIYDADRTGLVDYALESSGGQVVSTKCTESYQAKTAVISLLGVPLWYPSNTPRTVITPSVIPGECWAFQNFPGFLLLKLSARVRVEAFTMEHISKKLIANGKIDSAPKDFEVYGLNNDTDREPVLLGKYVYNFNGEPLQYFPVTTRGLTYNLIELRILSNHGNPNYTCLYRFRVHGTLNVEPT